MSDVVDKLLILVLVITLPIGIYFSAKVQEDVDIEQEELIEQEKMAKLDQTLEDLKTASAKEVKPVVAAIEPIVINKVTYASDSGKIKVEGKAPGTNLNVMVQAVVTGFATPTPKPVKIVKSASGSGNVVAKEDDSAVLGESVDVVAVKTDKNGSFVFVKAVDADDVAMLELRFDQAESTATIQYDFIAKKRIL